MDKCIYYRRGLIIDELNQFVTVTVQAHPLRAVKVCDFFCSCIDRSTITVLMA